MTRKGWSAIDNSAQTRTSGNSYDLVVIGGGINGVGIARDAVGRGLSVLLCEHDDLGSATSSASSKLLHGGLRYLEQFQFRMVRHALAEREILLDAAPHIVSPMRFVLPHNRSLRPYWMLRFGIFLYDRLAQRNSLPDSERLDFRDGADRAPLKADFERGFEYSDCWVDDSRLVILNAVDARNRGAEILTRTECTSANWVDERWEVELLDRVADATRTIFARALINAAGPWAESVARDVMGVDTRYSSRLVKGSHIVVKRFFDDDRAFILQNDDKRVVFVLPYEDDFTLVGTTDVPFEGDPAEVKIDDEEIDYLCSVVSNHFTTPIQPEDVIWTFSGVRPLYDDGSSNASSVSRDYILESHSCPTGDDLIGLTIWGGKLTGYRLLAEDVIERLTEVFPGMSAPWTAEAKLPGGDLLPSGLGRFTRMLTQVYDWIPPNLADAYARRYGSMVHTVLGNASSLDDLGPELAPGLFAREVDYLIRYEWARTAEDILWRRTKQGLRATSTGLQRLTAYVDERGRYLESDQS